MIKILLSFKYGCKLGVKCFFHMKKKLLVLLCKASFCAREHQHLTLSGSELTNLCTLTTQNESTVWLLTKTMFAVTLRLIIITSFTLISKTRMNIKNTARIKGFLSKQETGKNWLCVSFQRTNFCNGVIINISKKSKCLILCQNVKNKHMIT